MFGTKNHLRSLLSKLNIVGSVNVKTLISETISNILE